jgi:hypothetical protein
MIRILSIVFLFKLICPKAYLVVILSDSIMSTEAWQLPSLVNR